MNTAPGVCVLGWVKCREQNFTAGYTLYNYVCKKTRKSKPIFFFLQNLITDYGKMLKYREKYRSTDISVDLYSRLSTLAKASHNLVFKPVGDAGNA